MLSDPLRFNLTTELLEQPLSMGAVMSSLAASLDDATGAAWKDCADLAATVYDLACDALETPPARSAQELEAVLAGAIVTALDGDPLCDPYTPATCAELLLNLLP